VLDRHATEVEHASAMAIIRTHSSASPPTA
jgi:hypothetical protein